MKDIENNQLWQNFYIILRTTYPALRVLCAADSNRACMDKFYYLCHRTTNAITRSTTSLNDGDFITSSEPDDEAADYEVDSSDDDDDGSDDEFNERSFKRRRR